MGSDRFNLMLELFRACHWEFKCLSENTRRQILITLLEEGPLNVSQITQRTYLSQPAISHHLKELRLASLVHMRPVGSENYYEATLDPFLEKLSSIVQQFREDEESVSALENQ
ncbi:MAG: winged helix-turn-helix transcriptional regulator [Clostridiales bacterium]|jgi:ArsR family transcriptional regulator|nr:winged helix-turn-helix transcriptional regulator [Clostridiales bacterium]